MLSQWRVRLRALFRREAVEAEFDEELRYHLERETERYVSRGMNLEQARSAARRDLGDAHRVREEARETWRWRWMDELMQDVRYARRGLVRSAGFTVVAGLSLGFGIGATTTLFSVIDALDLRPLPYRDADRLVWVAEVRSAADRFCPSCAFGTSLSTADGWRTQARSYDGIALWSRSEVYFRQGDVAEYVPVRFASAGLFELLGVRPLLGRVIAPGDTVSGAERVALLSYDTWQSHFGGDPGVLGARFDYYEDRGLLEPRSVTVIGVLPEEFRFAGDATLWLPLTGRDARSLFIDAVARLRPAVSPGQAEAELRVISARQARADSEDRESTDVSVRPLRERLGMGSGRGRLLLFGITGLVLLIAVMNVAGVTLARTMAREGELTVRSTLGASPMRLVRQLLVEGVSLGAMAGVIGALLAIWGVRAASHWFELEGSGMSLRLDHRTLAFSAGAAFAVGILTALLPAVWAARSNLYSALGSRSGPGFGPRARAVTAALLSAQIAAGLVLVTGAGLLSSDFLELRYLDLGFDPDGLYQVSIFDGSDMRTEPEAWRPIMEEARRRVASVPGVASVALRHESALAPAVIRPDGSAEAIAHDVRRPRVQAVDVAYFETFRMAILAGREFTATDRRGDRQVCVLSTAAAAIFWPGENALGRQVFVGDTAGAGEWLTVVGVAADLEKGEMAERHWPIVYRPLEQAPLYHSVASLYVRMTGAGGGATLAAMQAAVREALGHATSALRPVNRELDERFLTERFNALALNVFAAFALLLAALGVYGSIAYAVTRRTREIGVRMALGADRGGVIRLMAGQMTWVAGAGVALGLIGAVVLTRVLRAFVSGTVANFWLFAGSACVVAIVALLASYLPARRAAAVDPLIALRSD